VSRGVIFSIHFRKAIFVRKREKMPPSRRELVKNARFAQKSRFSEC
jgi:hypothetical protein